MNKYTALITAMALLAGPVEAQPMPEEVEEPTGAYEQENKVECRSEQGEGFLAALTNIATCVTATLVDAKLQEELERNDDAVVESTEDWGEDQPGETIENVPDDEYADFIEETQPGQETKREARQRENRVNRVNRGNRQERTGNRRDYRRAANGEGREVRDRREGQSDREARSDRRQRDMRNRGSDEAERGERVAQRDFRK